MKLTKRGMTLFELLAVIVILGIIAAIAFPTVNALINNTRKDTFAANATSFANTGITMAKNEALALQDTNLNITYYFGTDPDYSTDSLTEPYVTKLTDIPTKNPFSGTAVYGHITVNVATAANGAVTVTVTEFLYTDGAGANAHYIDPTTVHDDDITIIRNNVLIGEPTDVTGGVVVTA